MNKKKIALIISGILGVFAISTLYFVPQVLPNFPLKIQNIYKLNANYEKTKNDITNLENQISIAEKDIKDNTPNKEIYRQQAEKIKAELDSINVPDDIDYASLLIFFEEKALQEGVFISTLDLQKNTSEEISIGQEKENNENNQEDTNKEENQEEDKKDNSVDEEETNVNKPTEDNNKDESSTNDKEENKQEEVETSLNFNTLSQHKVTLSVQGSYFRICSFLYRINHEIGDFAFIPKIQINRTSFGIDDWYDYESMALENEKLLNVNVEVVFTYQNPNGGGMNGTTGW